MKFSSTMIGIKTVVVSKGWETKGVPGMMEMFHILTDVVVGYTHVYIGQKRIELYT